MRVRVLLSVLVLIALAVPVSAQTVTSYRLDYYTAPNGAIPIATETFPAAAAICNQAPPAASSTVNPTRAVWDDKANPGKVCIFTSGSSSPMRTLASGNYEAVLVAINGAGSKESAHVPFSRLLPPDVPTGFSLIP